VRVIAFALALMSPPAFAQNAAQQELERGRALWDQRLSTSAIAALERATQDPATRAAALEALGRVYTFKGWQQDNIFPGWHDEPAYRERALTTLRAAIAADPSRASAQEALRTAESFAAADHVDPAPPRAEVAALDAKIDSLRSNAGAPIAEIVSAIDARFAAQADPAPYFTGAQILIDRGEYDRAIALAERGRAASDRFIDENSAAYQMPGKLQGSYSRGRATAADLIGWALFNKKDLAGAQARLEEAERLTQGQDFANQYHLGEVARAANAPDRARTHYLDALTLTAGPPPLRARATEALRALQSGNSGAGSQPFDAWLEAEVARRREARHVAALRSLVDRPLPRLPLTALDGRPFDTRSVQGKVLLLNFFASW